MWTPPLLATIIDLHAVHIYDSISARKDGMNSPFCFSYRYQDTSYSSYCSGVIRSAAAYGTWAGIDSCYCLLNLSPSVFMSHWTNPSSFSRSIYLSNLSVSSPDTFAFLSRIHNAASNLSLVELDIRHPPEHEQWTAAFEGKQIYKWVNK